MAKVPCPMCKTAKTVSLTANCPKCKGWALVQNKDGAFVPCPAHCNHGKVTHEVACPNCKGLGYVTE